MSVLVLGLNHKSAPVELLERLVVAPDELGKALYSATQRTHVAEAVVLSTCNRVEVYAAVTRYHGGLADLRAFLSEFSGVELEAFADLAFDYYDERAATHLFSVASGLDSMVVGERQIHLQVRQAFTTAQLEETVGPVLSPLFHQALRVGKRTRNETRVGDGASSMVDVALDAAEDVLGDLRGRTALLVGAGMMGGLAADRLQGVADRVLIANRTPEKAERLAGRVDGRALRFDQLEAGLREADVVLSSTGSFDMVVTEEAVRAAMADRPQRPLVLLDIAVPRDVDPACGLVAGVTALDIDDIRTLNDIGPAGEEVQRARAIVDEEVRVYAGRTRAARVGPTIAALRARGERVREAELARLAGRLGDLDEKQRGTLEALTRGMMNTLLHEPTVRLKALAESTGGDVHASALRELFDLDLDA